MPRTKSLKVLQRQIRELQLKAEKIEQAEKPGIRQLRVVLTRYKLSPADIKMALNGKTWAGGSKLAGRKATPKYRNPDNRMETWAGRGRMPLWMTALVQKGKKAEDFLIK